MKRLLALTLTALLALSACAPAPREAPASEEGYGLWFAVAQDSGRATSSAVVREERAWEKEPTALELLEALLSGPESDGLYSPFPYGVTVLNITPDETGKTLRVDLSEQYEGLAGFDLTVADYCIALTLCQLPQVETVRVTVEGKSLPYRDRQTMQAGDVLMTGVAEEPDTFLAALYFPSRNGEGLVTEYRQVTRSGDSAAEIVMVELLRGPTDAESCLSLPRDAQLLSLSVEDGVCQVNLSAEFLTNAPQEGALASLTLYALVNTLCALNGVSQVRLQIEGQAVYDYHGIAADSPLSPNFELVA